MADDDAMHRTTDDFAGALTNALLRWDLPIEPGQLDQLRMHFETVVEVNRTMNLTRITDPVEAAVKHFADSLALLLWVRDRHLSVDTVLDVGTGAGFPAVPLAVMKPQWSITAIDATRKKIEFLRKASEAIGLRNLHVEHAHSQHWDSPRRFPLVVFRAVARLPEAIKQIERHVDAGGRLVAYQIVAPESTQRQTAPDLGRVMGLEQQERFDYELVLGDETLARTLEVYRRGE